MVVMANLGLLIYLLLYPDRFFLRVLDKHANGGYAYNFSFPQFIKKVFTATQFGLGL